LIRAVPYAILLGAKQLEFSEFHRSNFLGSRISHGKHKESQKVLHQPAIWHNWIINDPESSH